MFPRLPAFPLSLIAVCSALAAGCATPDDPSVKATPDSERFETGDMVSPPQGLTVLYIGHSFGKPFATALPALTEAAGIEGHVAQAVKRGGVNGSPQGLWDDVEAREEVLEILATGEVDVMVMICCSPRFMEEATIGTDPAIGLWMDEALAVNPDTRFALALPWPDYPERDPAGNATYPDADSYSAVWYEGLSYWYALIDDLRANYPEVPIANLPHGRAALELRTLYEADNLPDVAELTSDTQPSIFTDTKGHADDVLVDLGTQIWLGVLYDLSPGQYPTLEGYDTDLVRLAEQVVAEDSMGW